ncbi:hypothetical protein SPRG_10347 [Saprolegnia parasitica CBS 223.65]|uniref:Uncharacterized protein n=1 Tax=Saprolegnia parasitica (strain CBS 223.65) TaxID=695850 RepID=A0A067CCI3_SAPPC|nr:hypothetical protein SPRG_10347 [Saprolegnia parasitica CBS 223.65]KDO24532.1 hypothetical protein SPRG_10347 [Saprolegnia parasitica CBS 223.65]|eukprot:XP_012204794.1 hypothetical protein SPRG_10347 [Saprolegnia parasitica CBS 223.65]
MTLWSRATPMSSASSSPSPLCVAASFEDRCKYAFKRCPNARSAKRNGQLHSYCEFHRRRANSTQKTYAMKKKEAMDLLDQSSAASHAVLVRRRHSDGDCLANADDEAKYAPLPFTRDAMENATLSWHEIEYVLRALFAS